MLVWLISAPRKEKIDLAPGTRASDPVESRQPWSPGPANKLGFKAAQKRAISVKMKTFQNIHGGRTDGTLMFSMSKLDGKHTVNMSRGVSHWCINTRIDTRANGSR